jgi:uncharacterized membrane protein/YHS domain-containing protein
VLAGAGAGLAAAVPLCALAARGGNLTAARVLLDSAAIVAGLVHAAALLPAVNRRIRTGAEVLFTAALALASMVSFMSLMDERGISSVAVVNTELLLNAGAVVLGACLIACLAPLTANAAPKSGNRVIAGCLLAASALVVVPRFADVLLGLMRLRAIEVTGGLLSFAAKTNKFAAAVPYLQLAMAAGLAAVFARRRSVFAAGDLSMMPSAQRRQALAVVQREARWVRASAALLCAALAALLAHDLYAGRPEKITRPVRLEADARGSIRVRIADVADGGLHRFSFLTDDGHVVRFLLIKLDSLTKKSRIGVVYDACVMCGDRGYIQRKHEVICLACNVRIFNPSIGKEGGCNPIPLKHAVEGEDVVIGADELTRGAKHFSQVVSIRVKDPVTGKELDSLRAPSRHEYLGANYFFESEASQARFLASPATYARKPLP